MSGQAVRRSEAPAGRQSKQHNALKFLSNSTAAVLLRNLDGRGHAVPRPQPKLLDQRPHLRPLHLAPSRAGPEQAPRVPAVRVERPKDPRGVLPHRRLYVFGEVGEPLHLCGAPAGGVAVGDRVVAVVSDAKLAQQHGHFGDLGLWYYISVEPVTMMSATTVTRPASDACPPRPTPKSTTARTLPSEILSFPLALFPHDSPQRVVASFFVL